MALSNSASDEIKKAKGCETRTKPLRDRMDEDFALFTLDPAKYCIPTEEGEWMKAVVNNAATDGNRMIDLLSYAQEKLKIAITDEKQKERDDLTGTEHAAIGLLHLADKINEDDPEAPSVRAQDSAFAVLRGWTSDVVHLTEDDAGEIFPHLKSWDIRNVYWIYGHNRLMWTCNIRYASPEELHDEYPDWEGYNSSGDVLTSAGKDIVEVHEILECSEKGKVAQEGVAVKGEWVKNPEDITVGGKPLLYIPVRIKAGRSLPLIRGGTDSQNENIKHVGESFLCNVREILPLESRLFIYRMTRARDLAQSANVVSYDSSKSEGKPPSGFEKASQKGRTAYLDSFKGEKLEERMTPPQGTEIELASGQTANMRQEGTGISSMAYGIGPYPSTAQGTDIINHNILDAIKPFKQLIESGRVWMAEEFIRQYKYGKFKGNEFEGYDHVGKRFKAKVKPKDIKDDWKFECKLVLDLVRDKNLNVGMAATAIKSGVLSGQTSRDEFDLCRDPDGEQAIIDRERASEVGELALLKTAKELWEDGDDFSKLQASQIFIKMMGNTQQQQQPGPGGQPGVMNPEATAGGARNMEPVPPPVRDAARQRGKSNA